MTNLKGTGYRLPSEAQWEYAARGGTSSRYWSGDTDNDLLKVDWSGSNSDLRTHEVGELSANPFGLFDVHGNVAEFCEEWFQLHPNETNSALGAVVSHGTFKLTRGGLWGFSPNVCTSAGAVRVLNTGRCRAGC